MTSKKKTTKWNNMDFEGKNEILNFLSSRDKETLTSQAKTIKQIFGVLLGVSTIKKWKEEKNILFKETAKVNPKITGYVLLLILRCTSLTGQRAWKITKMHFSICYIWKGQRDKSELAGEFRPHLFK